MEGYLPNRNLIFFSPGCSGAVFIHPAKCYLTLEQLIDAQEFLTQETKSSVVYIEDRRDDYRRQEDTLIDSGYQEQWDQDSNLKRY